MSILYYDIWYYLQVTGITLRDLILLSCVCYVLQVSGIEPSLMCGYMHWSADCKRWSRLWFAVHKDFVLFSFKAHQVTNHPMTIAIINNNNCNL